MYANWHDLIKTFPLYAFCCVTFHYQKDGLLPNCQNAIAEAAATFKESTP